MAFVPTQQQVSNEFFVEWYERYQDLYGRLSKPADPSRPQTKANPIAHLVSTDYTEIIDSITGVHANITAGNPPPGGPGQVTWDDLYDYSGPLLEAFEERLKELIEEEEGPSSRWYSALYTQVQRIGASMWNRYRLGVMRHFGNMTFLLQKHKPLPSSAWKDGDIVSNATFDENFDSFLALGRESPPVTEEEVRSLVVNSQFILRQALLAVVFDETLGTPSPEFSQKKDVRRGSVTPEDAAMEQASTVKSPKNKKRRKIGSSALKKRKKIRDGPDPFVDYTLENADADIELLRYQAGIADAEEDEVTVPETLDTITEELNKVTEGLDLMTMTGDLPVATLRDYRPSLQFELEKYKFDYEKALAITDRPEAANFLRNLEVDIRYLRQCIQEYEEDHPTDNTYIKKARIDAFVLKYIRSLHVRVAVATWTDREKSLRGRLEDWIVYERAWNRADELQVLRQGRKPKPRTPMGQEPPKNAYQQRIDSRNANISEWTQLLESLKPRHEDSEQEESMNKDDQKSSNKELHLGDLDFYRIRLHDLLGRRARAGRTQLEDPKEINKKTDEDRKEEAELLATLAANFAPGGPPQYTKHPVDTVYHRIQYMIVLTQWRCLQAQPLLPTVSTTPSEEEPWAGISHLEWALT
ncbi:hypothetical protein BJ170DRAFT_725904 [Xylariales sp. AK1849]|nr:hypothetical protein BJ170DRAFT_725904 [Xylariales sp. AK1849]